MNRKWLTGIFVLLYLCIPFAAFAEEATEEKKAEKSAFELMIEERMKLRDWWSRSSYMYDDETRQKLLWHVELRTRLQSFTGNTDGEKRDLASKFILRKGSWTNNLHYGISKEDTSNAGGGKMFVEYNQFHESVAYDFNDKFYAQGGYIWEKDSDNLIEDRDILFGGMGTYLMDSDTQRMNLFLAYAKVNEAYDCSIPRAGGPAEKEFPGLYFQEMYMYRIGEMGVIFQLFRIMHSMDDFDYYEMGPMGPVVAGQKKRDRTRFEVGTEIGIGPMASFVLSYRYDYDNIPWPSVEKKDVKTMTELKFMF